MYTLKIEFKSPNSVVNMNRNGDGGSSTICVNKAYITLGKRLCNICNGSGDAIAFRAGNVLKTLSKGLISLKEHPDKPIRIALQNKMHNIFVTEDTIK